MRKKGIFFENDSKLYFRHNGNKRRLKRFPRKAIILKICRSVCFLMTFKFSIDRVFVFFYLFILNDFNKTSAFKCKNEFNVTIANKKCHEEKNKVDKYAIFYIFYGRVAFISI